MLSNPGFIADFLRGLFALLDRVGYFFLGGIFNVFFTVVRSSIFQGDTISTFYERVQLILAIVMVFRLSLTLLQIIVNPDMAKDSQKGVASLIKRIAVMLVMLSLIVPMENIPSNRNSLNQQIKSNGVLFGILYELQDTVLEENILSKLVLGSSLDTDSMGLQEVGDVITADVASAFITPTVNDGYDDVTSENYEEAAACPDSLVNLNYYSTSAKTSSTLLDHINYTCVGIVSGDEEYVFDYTILGGLICSIVMTIIIIGFTVDVAVRAIKLAILRLIAPIPIISYVSPGADKGGPFNNWIKTLTSTYLSLFIRLIIIYFGIYLIVLLRNGDLVTWANSSSSTFTNALANIFIIIGILVFMKEAPKFLQDMLGIKGDGKLFSGIGAALGAAALTGGLVGSIATNYRAAYGEAREDGRGKFLSGALGVASGLAGGVGGAFVGAKALASTDKKQGSAVFSAMQRRNAMRAEGASLPKRAFTGASAILTGQAPGTSLERQHEAYQDFIGKAKAQLSMAEEESKTDNNITGSVAVMDMNGNMQTISANYRSFETMVKNAQARGERSVRINGHDINLDSITGNTYEELSKSQAFNWAREQKTMDPSDSRYNKKFAGTTQELKYSASNLQIDLDAYDYKDVKAKMGDAMNDDRDAMTSHKHDRYKAAARYVGAPPPGSGKH